MFIINKIRQRHVFAFLNYQGFRNKQPWDNVKLLREWQRQTGSHLSFFSQLHDRVDVDT